MRIRKHAHLSPLVNGGSALNPDGKSVVKDPHVCRLNQSPWDVLTSPLSDYLQQLPPQQEDEEEDPTIRLPLPPPPPVDGADDSSMENGSFTDCPELENSGLSVYLEKLEDTTDSEGDRMSGGRKKIEERRNSKKPGKNNNPVSSSSRRSSRVVRPKKPVSSSLNPNDYYYYSGFGPSWGRSHRRSGGGGGAAIDQPEAHSLVNIGLDVEEDGRLGDESYTNSESLENDNADNNPQASPAGQIREFGNGLDYLDDDDETDEDDNGNFGPKKRARKPVKARSLKSLM